MRLNVFIGIPGTYGVLNPYLEGDYAIPYPPADWTLKPDVIKTCPEKMFLIFNLRDRNKISDLSIETLISDVFFEDAEYPEGLVGIDIKKIKGIKNLWEKATSGTRFFFFKATDSQAVRIKEYSEILAERPDRLERTMNRTTPMELSDAIAYEQELLPMFDTSDYADLNINLAAISWKKFDANSFKGGAEPESSDVLVKLVVKS